MAAHVDNYNLPVQRLTGGQSRTMSCLPNLSRQLRSLKRAKAVNVYERSTKRAKCSHYLARRNMLDATPPLTTRLDSWSCDKLLSACLTLASSWPTAAAWKADAIACFWQRSAASVLSSSRLTADFMPENEKIIFPGAVIGKSICRRAVLDATKLSKAAPPEELPTGRSSHRATLSNASLIIFKLVVSQIQA